MDLVPTTSAVIFPFAAADLHDYLRVVVDDDDADILDMVKAATSAVEQKLERSLLTQTWTLMLDDFATRITLPRPPIASVTSVKYYDDDNVFTTLVLDTDYHAYVSEHRGLVYLPDGATWPSSVYSRPDAVQVEYVAGWTVASLIPRDIMSAIRLMVGTMYANRESIVVGTITSEIAGRFTAGLLDRYRIYS